MQLADAMIKRIESRGWLVKTYQTGSALEMHVIKLDGTEQPLIARCNNGVGEYDRYRCACLLAEAVESEGHASDAAGGVHWRLTAS
jgi:hypothetical protein